MKNKNRNRFFSDVVYYILSVSFFKIENLKIQKMLR